MKQNNILAIIVWVIGLLGLTGHINQFGFYALLIPIIFLLFGNKLTKQHCKAYFNILITTVIMYYLGMGLNIVFGLFKEQYNFRFIVSLYFALMNILGLISAIRNKRYKPILSINLFR